MLFGRFQENLLLSRSVASTDESKRTKQSCSLNKIFVETVDPVKILIDEIKKYSLRGLDSGEIYVKRYGSTSVPGG